MRRLPSGPIDGWAWDEPMRLTHSQCLLAVGRDDDGNRALSEALNVVVKRARALTRPAHRQAYISRNPDARAILELAERRLRSTFPERLDTPPA